MILLVATPMLRTYFFRLAGHLMLIIYTDSPIFVDGLLGMCIRLCLLQKSQPFDVSLCLPTRCGPSRSFRPRHRNRVGIRTYPK